MQLNRKVTKKMQIYHLVKGIGWIPLFRYRLKRTYSFVDYDKKERGFNGKHTDLYEYILAPDYFIKYK